MNGFEIALAATPGCGLAGWMAWLNYRLIRDGRVRTAPQPRTPAPPKETQ